MDQNDINLNDFPDAKIWATLNCAGFAVYRLRELELDRLGLTVEQSSILYILKSHHQGSATIQQLVVETLHQSNSVYTLINRMAKMGLIAKVGNPEEKKIFAGITGQGEEVLKRVTFTSLEMAFSPLAIEDKIRLAQILAAIVSKARDLLGIPYKPPIMQYLDEGKSAGLIKPESRFGQNISDTQLWAVLNSARFAISRVREIELSHFGLTIEQSSILYFLRERGGSTTVMDLVDGTMRQPNSVYTLINRMVKMGLVAKIEKPDEKKAFIETTPNGADLLRKATTTSLEMLFAVLTAEEKVELIKKSRILINRARDLLGIPYKMPILQYLKPQ